MVQIAGFAFYLLSVQALATAGVGIHVFLTGGSASDLLPIRGSTTATDARGKRSR